MNVSALNNSTLSTTNVLQITQPADVSSQFAALMHRSQQDTTPVSDIEKSARQLLGVALFEPLLAQAHESAFKSDLFHGGEGEKAFQSQLDQILADRMSQRPDYPLVKAIVNKFASQARTAQSADTVKVNLHG